MLRLEHYRQPIIIGLMPDGSNVSIIVPAYREAPNIAPLVTRSFAALRKAGMTGELIIVDDNSNDGTEAAVASLQAGHPVRLIVRRHERGLSSAVLRGFDEARNDIFVVLDADLQHPPELIPDLVRRLERGDCEFVMATRYGGGAVSQEWPWYRRLGSLAATALARPMAPTTDPMSGFFALYRRTWQQAERLDPIGYKIALELIVKCRCRSLGEVPIEFSERTAGESKASAAEAVRYLRHLGRLYRFRFPGAYYGVLIALAGWLVVAIWWAMRS